MKWLGVTTHLPWINVSPSHGEPLLPHPLPWHFIRLSWLISATHLYSWEERESEREKCSAQEQNTLTRQGYKGRPDPESTLLIIRPPFLPQEGRVYAESFLIRNKFYKIVIFKKQSLVKTNKKACL